jgi:hypothetical protein
VPADEYQANETLGCYNCPTAGEQRLAGGHEVLKTGETSLAG